MNPQPHPACLDDDALRSQCETTRARRRGPGGQHRNKVETAIILRHVPTGVRAEASERRSQAENLRQATFRLRLNLALEVRSPAREVVAPSELWDARVEGSRIAVNPRHADFPSLLAEALDALDSRDWDHRAAATALEVTPSQLVKFLKDEPRALEQVNRRRAERGLRSLK